MIPWHKQQENDKNWYKSDVNKNIALHLSCDYFTLLYKNYCKALHGKTFTNALDIGISNTGGYLSFMPGIKKRIALDTAVDYLREVDMLPLHKKIKYVNGNAEQMPFESSYFDLVIITNALDHVNNMKRCVDEIYRVLKPDGYLFYAVYLRVTKPHPWTFQTWEEARAMFSEMGVAEHYELTDNRPYYSRNNCYISILKRGVKDAEIKKENLL